MLMCLWKGENIFSINELSWINEYENTGNWSNWLPGGFVVAVGSVVVGVTKMEQKHIRESFWKKIKAIKLRRAI